MSELFLLLLSEQSWCSVLEIERSCLLDDSWSRLMSSLALITEDDISIYLTSICNITLNLQQPFSNKLKDIL